MVEGYFSYVHNLWIAARSMQYLMNMTLTPAQYGALKQLGFAVGLVVITFVSQAANISPFIGAGAATIIAMLAGSIEEYLKDPATGTALFGAVTVQKPQ